jgi:thiol-disulfide isomerase/thioredoxin
MKRSLALLIFCALAMPAQVTDEQKELNAALAEAGASPIEYLRALEKHLEKYPNSPRRTELERAAARAAIEAHNNAAVVLYGERVLARQGDDLQILDAVAQALLAANSSDPAQRAAKYARRYQELYRYSQGSNQVDRGVGHGLVLEARSAGVQGHSQEALDLAHRSFETWPDAESAREIARCSERLGKFEEAARALADAFTIPDPRATDADRAADRARMGKLYQQAKGTLAGLGDLVLEAYDRNQALVHIRALRLPEPLAVADPIARELTSLDGRNFAMAGLKGKVIVLDFWATWCIPCREQHPLYAQVRDRFRGNTGVTFLSVNADDERARVKPFLEEEKWPDEVFFANAMDRALNVTSFPTTIVLDKHGQVFSRLTGFVPERFVETLTSRIRAALEAQ